MNKFDFQLGLKKITFEYKSRFPTLWLGEDDWFLISTIKFLFLSYYLASIFFLQYKELYLAILERKLP